MTTNASVFCDTNVVIRLNVAETPEHEQVKAAISALLANQNILWLSRQVLREFCAVLTRPQTFPTPPRAVDVTARARALAGLFQVADETRQVTDNLLVLLETVPLGGKQVHDANIVATMQTQDIRHLFTLNPGDFMRFAPYITTLTLEAILSAS
jgi:predicted nucleic acid-binding protein